MKRTLLIMSLLIVPTIASAQSTVPTELNLKLTPAEADLVWKGLRKLPVEDVEILMNKVRQQVSEQTTPKPVEPPKVEPKKDK